ncbi:cupin domain-containing protein, partial [Saccharothrix violaceirubra]
GLVTVLDLDVDLVPDGESAVAVLSGSIVHSGLELEVGEGVYCPGRVSPAAPGTRVLVVGSPGPPGTPAVWTRGSGSAGDLVLAEGGGFVDMAVRWLVTDDTVGARGIVVATSVFRPGGHHRTHRHPNAAEFFLVLSGGGLHLAPDGPIRVGPGDLVFVPADEPHGFRTDPGTVTTTLYGYLGVGSLDQAGYAVDEGGDGR